MIVAKRKAIIEVLKNNIIDKPILLPYSTDELKEIFFDIKEDKEGNKYYIINGLIKKVQSMIDYSNIPFDNVYVAGVNFSNAYGLKLNPQCVYKKNFEGIILSKNAEIIGNDSINQRDLFEGVNIKEAEFNSCKNVRINPQTIIDKDLSGTVLEGVDFTGFSFDGVKVWRANFKGSMGAKFNPNKVIGSYNAYSLADVTLTDLPEEPPCHNNYNYLDGSNYQELVNECKKMEATFYELIKDQLPPKTEPEPVVEEPKQKRKWFGSN